MRGIILKDSIKLFGFRTAIPFWFRWSFIDPIKQFIWLNITYKSYCPYSGWYCDRENCSHKHLTTKKEILEDWKEAEKEMNRVETGKDGKCVYCGEEKGTIQIDNPNFDEINQWLVCKICKEVIELQRELTLPFTSIERQQEINDRLLEITEQTGRHIMNMQISKEKEGYKVSSVEFKGEKNDK